MTKIRISAVSYLNSLPFVYGLKHSGLANECEISLDTPAVCADKLISGKVDIGLIPVASIPKVPNAKIISDYCIGANGEVKTVCLYSEVPLKEIKTILLDYQSRTSVLLTRVLAKKFWKINPEWVNAEQGFEQKINGTTAGVVIGDRTFHLSPRPPLHKRGGALPPLVGEGWGGGIFDLASEWKNFTGLPFVFACWVSNKELPEKFISAFNSALKSGVNNIDKTLEESDLTFITKEAAKEYLTKNINYQFDQEKKKALKLFNEYGEKVNSNS